MKIKNIVWTSWLKPGMVQEKGKNNTAYRGKKIHTIFSRKLDRSNIFRDSRYMFYEIFDIMKSRFIISGLSTAYFALFRRGT